MGCSLGKRVQNEPDTDNFDVSVLVVGPEQSGKTTLCRAAAIECGEYGGQERRMYMADEVRSVIHEKLRQVYDVASDLKAISNEVPFNEKQWEQFQELDGEPQLNEAAVKAIDEMAKSGTLLQISDMTHIGLTQNDIDFLRNVAIRSLSESYVPTNEDLLRCHWSTRGMQYHRATYNGVSIRFIDVGGSKQERFKWTFAYQETFEYVTIVLSLASVLSRDCGSGVTAPGLADSLAIFSEIMSCEAVSTCRKVVLFLTKKDLLDSALKSGRKVHDVGVEGIGAVRTSQDVVTALTTKMKEIGKEHGVEISNVFQMSSLGGEERSVPIQEFLAVFAA